jgi:hypothetical protein
VYAKEFSIKFWKSMCLCVVCVPPTIFDPKVNSTISQSISLHELFEYNLIHLHLLVQSPHTSTRQKKDQKTIEKRRINGFSMDINQVQEINTRDKVGESYPEGFVESKVNSHLERRQR